jgi:hypothetical protein
MELAVIFLISVVAGYVSRGRVVRFLVFGLGGGVLVAIPVLFFVVPCRCHDTRRAMTRATARAIEQAVEVGRAERTECMCPTPERLRREGFLEASKLTDAWGSPFTISCADAEAFTVISPGADRIAGTADDVILPVPAQQQQL